MSIFGQNKILKVNYKTFCFSHPTHVVPKKKEAIPHMMFVATQTME